MTDAEHSPETRVRPWKTLLTLNIHSPSLTWLLLLLSALSSLIYDLGREGLSASSLGFAGLALASQVSVMLGLVWLSSLLPHQIVRILAHGISWLCSIVLKGWLTAVLFAPETWGEMWAIRLPGDITGGILVWFALTISLAHRDDYLRLLTEATNAQRVLSEKRAQRNVIAAEINQELKNQAFSALQPSLDALSAALKDVRDNSDLQRVSHDINSVIDQSVRPLSRSLAEQTPLSPRADRAEDSGVEVTSLSDVNVSVRHDMRALTSYLFASLNIFATVAQLGSLGIAVIVQIASASYWLTLEGLRRLWPVNRHLGFVSGLALIGLFAAVAYVPTGFLMSYFASEYPLLQPIVFSAGGVWVFATVVTAGWRALARRRLEHLSELNGLNLELEREITHVNQTLWVLRRKWAYLIHGTIQASLTIAASKATHATSITPRVLDDINQALGSASRALEGFFEEDARIEDLLEDITEAWAGVCEVTIDIDQLALHAVAEDPTSRMCVNEIVKEVVSNAYRHGHASTVMVQGRLGTSGDLELEVTNNGTPIDTDAEPGLGFSTITQLSSHWQIADGRRGIHATIPLAL